MPHQKTDVMQGRKVTLVSIALRQSTTLRTISASTSASLLIPYSELALFSLYFSFALPHGPPHVINCNLASACCLFSYGLWLPSFVQMSSSELGWNQVYPWGRRPNEGQNHVCVTVWRGAKPRENIPPLTSFSLIFFFFHITSSNLYYHGFNSLDKNWKGAPLGAWT